MHVIVARPFDDEDIVEVYLVHHDSGKKTAKAFEAEWDKALVAAKKAAPETWAVSEVITTLEKSGWQILQADHTVVTY